MKRYVLVLLLLILVVPALLAPAFAAAGDVLDPEVLESSETAIPPEMELLAAVMGKALAFLQFEFTLWGFTLSFWGIGLFLIIVGIVIALVRRFVQ